MDNIQEDYTLQSKCYMFFRHFLLQFIGFCFFLCGEKKSFAALNRIENCVLSFSGMYP